MRVVRPRNWRWHVVVRLNVDCQAVGYRALGPISWTHARELAAAWERTFGVGTAALAERLGTKTRRVEVWAPGFQLVRINQASSRK